MSDFPGPLAFRIKADASGQISKFSYANSQPLTSTGARESRKHRKASSERTALENGAHLQNLELGRSRAVGFSWTSRFPNLKLHGLILISDNPQQNLPYGRRDIFDFVKIFFEKA